MQIDIALNWLFVICRESTTNGINNTKNGHIIFDKWSLSSIDGKNAWGHSIRKDYFALIMNAVNRRQRRIRSFDTKKLLCVNDECCESTTYKIMTIKCVDIDCVTWIESWFRIDEVRRVWKWRCDNRWCQILSIVNDEIYVIC